LLDISIYVVQKQGHESLLVIGSDHSVQSWSAQVCVDQKYSLTGLRESNREVTCNERLAVTRPRARDEEAIEVAVRGYEA
jgi:hypothetical protein